MRLGKQPPVHDPRTLTLEQYATSTIAAPPASDTDNLKRFTDWHMLGNDTVGDCVWAGAAHETMMWNKERSLAVAFSSASVLSDYSAVTGFNPKKPNTDQGTDMGDAAAYRRKTGILDAAGLRHTVAGYLAITPGDLTELYIAVYLFGAVGIGIEFPSSAMDQFNAGKPWDVVSHATIEGGHYVPLVAKRTNLVCVTWARTQQMTTKFFGKYNDESVAYVSYEALANNKSPEGFNAAQLLADLQALTPAKGK